LARTTRLNISVPVALSERLRKEADRVNVSRVCVAALERELGVREARPTVDAGQLERLVQRLQSNRERWSERGRGDGERWAVETAKTPSIGVASNTTEPGEGLACPRSARTPRRVRERS